ncbi:MAG: prepilin-type N-terminal cleavage/methylation domain-containing protein [Opitutaceae bacterium]|jgi:prepilin-type N-terminal cleavage/methylation domain-containing protein/prepilin-type processing-associated H-X9-DG protein|nr:prepilin-type N-terminal cleavage/methylation domain-containing protein [Opitutaceae bacterium]
MRTRRSTGAFTLVELLTVIAIIGILAAIIIPAAQRVRKTALQAAGRSNLRQLMAATLAYTSENRDSPPGPAARAQYAVLRKNDETQLSWVLRDYLGVPAKALDNTVLPAVIPPLLLAKYNPATTAAYFALGNIYLSRTEMLKPWGATNSDWKAWYPESWHNPMMLAAIPDPSRHVALMDLDLEVRPETGAGSVAIVGVMPVPLHDNSRNAAFWDGHVATLPLDYNLYPGYTP